MTNSAWEVEEERVPPGATGVLTFLIADVRGYTGYTFERGDEAAATVAARFADLVAEEIHEWGGRLLELRGDEALVVFTSARSALRAAIALQERFGRERSSSFPLSIGIGLDTGEAIPVKGGYRGGALNVAARLCSMARPGDVLASEGTVRMVRMAEGVQLVDRGPVTLKGVPEPVRVYQVAADGALPANLPPLQEPATRRPRTLPSEPTPFVGREREIDEVMEVLRRPGVRLLTLSGAGGMGKTRLATQVASALDGDFPDGIFFVPLASLRDSQLVMSTLATTLGAAEESGRGPMEACIEILRDARALLVLDNFEHVRAAAPLLSELLAACPRVTALATSRAVLNEYGEYAYEVPPLSTPDPVRLPPLAALARFEAVSLFVERAQAVKPSFALTAENASAVAQICHRLDGLPLAIELAAARTRILPPAALLPRLESRLQVLVGGARGMPERQKTLRATIDWSYSLLGEMEQALFARLSVFAGGCTLEAAEAVCDPHGDLELDILDGIATLVENSLLRQEDDPSEAGGHFVMLETVREYAAGQLEAGGEAAEVRDRHAAYFASLAEEAEPGLRGPEQASWLERLNAEHDNMRAALGWLVDSGRWGEALHPAAALWRFWWVHCHLSEGRRWLETILSASAGDTVTRAAAINGLANLAWAQGDLDRAEELHHEALRIREVVGDRLGVALSLNNLGIVTDKRGDFEAAAAWYQRSLEVAREVDDDWTVALVLGNLAGVLGGQGRHEEATRLAEESLRRWRELGDRAGEGRVLNALVTLAIDTAHHERAAALQQESLALYRGLGNQENVAYCLEGAAKILGRTGRTRDAARLWSAADALRRALEQPLSPSDRQEADTYVEEARSQLDQYAFAAAWAEGEAMSSDEAVGYALQVLPLV